MGSSVCIAFTRAHNYTCLCEETLGCSRDMLEHMYTLGRRPIQAALRRYVQGVNCLGPREEGNMPAQAWKAFPLGPMGKSKGGSTSSLDSLGRLARQWGGDQHCFSQARATHALHPQQKTIASQTSAVPGAM